MKKFKKISIIVISILLILIIILLLLFKDEIKTLRSIKILDKNGMYSMIYYGDYDFDDFLKQGAKTDKEIENYVVKKILKGIPISIDIDNAGCTAFVTKNEKGEAIYARDFDYTSSPAMQVYTNPKNGYASVSTVNLSFIGYSDKKLPTDGFSFRNFLTLAAPYIPFDGMNEKGVTIAILAVPKTEFEIDSKKVTLNTTTAVRLVLDKAATIEEAIELLSNYNIYFSEDIYCHFLIGDSTGKSVVVEFYDDSIQIIEPEDDYQVLTNFLVSSDLQLSEGYNSFERYDTVIRKLRETDGVIEFYDTMNLLNKVGMYNDEGISMLQWSVIYNMTNKTGSIWYHKNTENIINFELK